MATGSDPHALIDLIYEAAIEGALWPSALVKLAEAIGVEQIAVPSMDWRANVFNTIAPRLDPALLASYKEYWAFQDPVLAGAMRLKAGEICTVDKVMPRAEFAATPVYNEFWHKAGYSLDTVGANLLVEDQFASLICVSNKPGQEPVNDTQIKFLKVILPHLTRAVRINRRLWDLGCHEIVAEEGLEDLPQGALLADASARVIYANRAAKSMLDEGQIIYLENGRLVAAGFADALQRAIASCTCKAPSLLDPAADFTIPQKTPGPPILVSVTPLRSKTRLADVPWTSHGVPVALVTAQDPEMEHRQREASIRRHFGLTTAESALAVEILKGDGRMAAARRCGVTSATAKTHLSSIFSKTGTHRQAELVRVLLSADDRRGTDVKRNGSARTSGTSP